MGNCYSQDHQKLHGVRKYPIRNDILKLIKILNHQNTVQCIICPTGKIINRGGVIYQCNNPYCGFGICIEHKEKGQCCPICKITICSKCVHSCPTFGFVIL